MSATQSGVLREYRYRARSERGELVGGTMSARSRDGVGSALSGQGLYVIEIETVGRKPAGAKPPGASRSQIAWQMSQLATMLESGMALSESLSCLAGQADQPRLRGLLEDVSRSVSEGNPLSEAMARYPKAFPSAMIAMTRASEMTGSLSTVLRRSTADMLKDAQVMARMRSAMAYPVFMLGLCLVIVVFLISFVLPTFAAVFESQGAALPAPTRLLMSVSRSITGAWEFWLLAGVVAGVAALAWARSHAGRRAIDSIWTCVPLVSPLYNTLHQGRAFRTLAMLLSARAPLIDAIRVVQDVVPNHRYRFMWAEMEEQVRVGARLAAPLYNAGFVEDATAQMVDNGDRSGNLAGALESLSSHMEERFAKSIGTATQLIEPVMILLMGGVLGFVAIAMMLPLFRSAWVIAG